jgi:exonuclease SbcC
MIIKSIQLHPFGGAQDKTFTFEANGISIIQGPNETGKSTMARALYAALFIHPDEYNKKKKSPLLAQSIPVDGDHARVTLVFSDPGGTYTLTKEWSKTPSASLQTPTVYMTEIDNIQKVLISLIGYQEGTFSNVFYLDQAMLDQTADRLNDTQSRDEFKKVLGGDIINYGQVNWDGVIIELKAIIDRYFGRWDTTLNRPESNRGIENQWVQGKGKILDEYYAFKKIESDYGQVKQNEEAIDRCNTELAVLNPQFTEADAFLNRYRSVVSGIQLRQQKQQQLDTCRGLIKQYKHVNENWPLKIARIGSIDESLERISNECDELNAELTTSEERANGQALRIRFSDLLELTNQINHQQQLLDQMQVVDGDHLERAEELMESIANARITLEAQKLGFWVKAKSGLTATITDPLNGASNLSLNTGDEHSIAGLPGMLEFESDSVHIMVTSEAGNAEEIAAGIQANQEELQIIMDQYLAKRPTDLIGIQERWSEQSQAVAQLTRQFNTMLAGRPFEEYQQQINQLDALPATRDKNTLNNLILERGRQQNILDTEKQGINQQLFEYQNQFASIENLTLLYEQQLLLKARLENELPELSKLPEGFESVEAFIYQFNNVDNNSRNLKDSIHNLKVELTRLTANPPEFTLEELTDMKAEAETAWQRALKEGAAYKLLQKQIARFDAEVSTGDPFADYKENLRAMFSNLTDGKYSSINFKDMIPAQLDTAGGELPANWLSQGTRDSLAFAIRLTMAEHYLDGKQGFMLMDDPMTNMDKERKKLAWNQLKEFAKDKQVILLTCHED